jgi:hypothetical protein
VATSNQTESAEAGKEAQLWETMRAAQMGALKDVREWKESVELFEVYWNEVLAVFADGESLDVCNKIQPNHSWSGLKHPIPNQGEAQSIQTKRFATIAQSTHCPESNSADSVASTV